MADARPLCVGFSSATRVARFQLGNLEVRFYDEARKRWRVFVLTEEMLRIIDLNLERWRREEHEAVLLTMNRGVLGETLCDAAEAGGLRDTTFLVVSRGVYVNHIHRTYDYTRNTALTRSSDYGRLEVVRFLLDAGAIDGALHRLEWPLYYACSRGHTPVVALLLDRGANVHFGAEVSLRNAAEKGHTETLRLLIDRGGVPDGDMMRRAQLGRHYATIALLRERGVIDPQQ